MIFESDEISSSRLNHPKLFGFMNRPDGRHSAGRPRVFLSLPGIFALAENELGRPGAECGPKRTSLNLTSDRS